MIFSDQLHPSFVGRLLHVQCNKRFPQLRPIAGLFLRTCDRRRSHAKHDFRDGNNICRSGNGGHCKSVILFFLADNLTANRLLLAEYLSSSIPTVDFSVGSEEAISKILSPIFQGVLMSIYTILYKYVFGGRHRARPAMQTTADETTPLIQGV